MTVHAARRIYVIDDDREVLASMAFLLPALGYECTTFAGPEEFLGRCPALPPGCILTDLRMPGMDGFELASRIRGLGLGWPVVMMTSDTDASIERRAAGHGIGAVLHKPVDSRMLADALDRAFGGIEG